MKGLNKIWALALVPMLASCADYLDTTNNFEVDKPESVAQYEYLNNYGTLKSYIDRAAHPGFLLGTGVNAGDYLKKGGVYQLTNSNFDQVTTGNAMKYASCVDDNGNMDFGTVMEFVDAATSAGLEVYGHTLCWHAQQRPKWLKSLIADKEITVDPNAREEKQDYLIDYSKATGYNFWAPDEVKATISVNSAEGCLDVYNPTEDPENWHFQYHIGDGVALEKGKPYTLKMMVRGTGAGSIRLGVGPWDGRAEGSVDFNSDWQELGYDFTAVADNGHIMAQSGQFVGTIQIKYVKIVHYEAPVSEVEVEENRRAIQVSASDKVDYAWDTQFWIMTDATFNEGDTWEVSMNIRADKEAASETQVHSNAGDYLHYEGIGNPKFTRTWQNYTANGTFKAAQAGGHSIAFNLNVFDGANNYYFDDISFKVNGVELIKNSTCDDDNMKDNFIAKESRGEPGPARFVDKVNNVIKSNTQPLTSAEKAEILTAEMERWVKGMMEATAGKVKAWDVVNEPLSGSGGSRYDLQHGTPDNTTDFFWQDYLGDDYVRVPVKFARQYFEENGGNPQDLKLFINDYNLESWWDNNKKLTSLISWIQQWESDGETVIDGIGTQMHVSCCEKPEDQALREKHVTRMFELLAESGKLVRITELDMGMIDVEGKTVKTPDLTLDQKMLMADFWKFIVKEYFRIIPVAQQYGICAWAQTDSPAGSGWRGGEPIGLWDENLSRKPAYGGFADGLAGK